MDRQRQQGDDATNIQAGRDIVVHEGVSVEDVRQIALDVFSTNFLELRGVAEDVARGRAEKITTDFLEALQQRDAEALQSAADPDMQRSIFNAQKEYACSGDDELEEALVDLLVDRASDSQPGIRRIVLNEAITAAPKLTAEQRRAVAMCFLMRYTRFTGELSIDALYEIYIRRCIMPLASGLPTADSAYQHIEYVGAGSVSLGEVRFLPALIQKHRAWFTHGFAPDEAPEGLKNFLGHNRLFSACVRDPDRLQVAVRHQDDIEAVAKAVGTPELSVDLHQAFSMGFMSDDETREELLSRTPEIVEAIEAWDQSELRSLTLTTVGLAIGHGDWRRVTGVATPLSTWVGD